MPEWPCNLNTLAHSTIANFLGFQCSKTAIYFDMDVISESVLLQNKDAEVAQPADVVKAELNEEIEPKSEPQEVKAEPGPTVEAGAQPEAPVEEQAKMPSDVEIVEKLKELLSADGLDFQTVTGEF